MSNSVPVLKAIHEALCSDKGLSVLCTQNGWIDNDTLWFEIDGIVDGKALVSVHFEEIVTKGGGCIAKRQPCWGRVEVYLREREGVRVRRIQ